MSVIKLSHGSGGLGTNKLINDVILKYLGNPFLNDLRDAAKLYIKGCEIAFTTDSFVVTPEFFPGGDIGKLAVFGTCNDLAVSGAIPKYLSLSFIISEGYEIGDLERILQSISDAAKIADVFVVCGDTKVVERTGEPFIYLNTSGVGAMVKDINNYNAITEGDNVIISSDIARHGMAIMAARNEFGLESSIKSDCCNLYDIFKNTGYEGIKFARDATRGGVAAVLNEISSKSGLGFEIQESDIPLSSEVRNICEFFGFDPLSVANEGVAVLICDKNFSDKILENMLELKNCRSASLVGIVKKGKVVIKNSFGGSRVVETPSGELLPRIC